MTIDNIKNEAFIDKEGVLQINTTFVTEKVTKNKLVECDLGCKEVAVGYDELGIAGCYIPGNHEHYPMVKEIIYEGC